MTPRDRSENGGAGKVFALFAIFAALVGGGAWFYHQHKEQQREQARIAVVQRAEETRKAAELRQKAKEAEEHKAAEEATRQAAEDAARAAATEIRIKANVQKEKVGNISDADGFKTSKDELAVSFARAEVLFDEKTRRWNEAAVQFTNYVNECDALIALDGERQRAVAMRTKAEAAKSRAAEFEAEKYAATRWNEAVRLQNNAAGKFARMDFAEANGMFATAQEQFNTSVDEAAAECKRQADAAEAKAKTEQEARERAAVDAKNRVEPQTDLEDMIDAHLAGVPFEQDPNYELCTDVNFVPVYFRPYFGDSPIIASELPKIEGVAKYLQTNHDRVVIVEGNCDERGSNEYNLSLGEFRAIAVRDCLVSLGIDAHRIQTKSYGEEKPAVIGHDMNAWSKNGRVEFVVLKRR